MSNLDTETIIKKILAKVEDAFNELDLPKKPYGRNELWEGITNYLKIKQLRDKIEVYTSDGEYTSKSITIAGFHEIPQETVENTIIPALEEQLTQMFFNPDFYYRFEYKLTLVLEFQFGLGCHIQKKLHLEHPKRKAELKERLDFLAKNGFPNYFTEQRFGRDGNNLTQALRWANGEINVKDRNKRSFYLSAARSEIFNLIVSKPMELDLAQQILVGDVLQLNGSHSWFVVNESEDLAQLQQRLAQQDVLLTAPLISEEEKSAVDFEHEIFTQHKALFSLMRQERMKAARRVILMQPQHFQWQFEPNGLRLQFDLPAGSYATALIRELVNVEN